MARKPTASKPVSDDAVELRARLHELEETLRAIRSGQVDALVVYVPDGGDRVFTLQGAEHPYRVLVEAMNEGAATMTSDGLVLFANQHFARMLDIPLEKLIGSPLSEIVQPDDYASLDTLLKKVQEGPQKVESVWHVGKDKQKLLPVCLSLSPVREGEFQGVCVIATDLTEQRHREQELAQTNAALINEVDKRMRVEDALRRDEESLRQLSGRLLQLQDEERRRIARDLHDSTGQKLVALTLDLTVLGACAPKLPPKASAAVNECLVLAEQISSEIRTLSYLLHPPLLDEVGLASAVQWYIDGFTRRSNIRVNLEFPPQVPRLKHELEITFFRILQEALTNVHRHSGSKVATVRFGLNHDGVTLEVQDNGRRAERTSLGPSGEAVGTLGVGIRGMQERVHQLGGQFEVIQTPVALPSGPPCPPELRPSRPRRAKPPDIVLAPILLTFERYQLIIQRPRLAFPPALRSDLRVPWRLYAASPRLSSLDFGSRLSHDFTTRPNPPQQSRCTSPAQSLGPQRTRRPET